MFFFVPGNAIFYELNTVSFLSTKVDLVSQTHRFRAQTLTMPVHTGKLFRYWLTDWVDPWGDKSRPVFSSHSLPWEVMSSTNPALRLVLTCFFELCLPFGLIKVDLCKVDHSFKTSPQLGSRNTCQSGRTERQSLPRTLEPFKHLNVFQLLFEKISLEIFGGFPFPQDSYWRVTKSPATTIPVAVKADAFGSGCIQSGVYSPLFTPESPRERKVPRCESDEVFRFSSWLRI